MKHVYGLVLIIWLATEQIQNTNIGVLSIASLLGALCLFIIKERYFDRIPAVLFFAALVLILSRYTAGFILLLGIPLLDLSYYKRYYAAAALFIASVFLCIMDKNTGYLFHLASSGVIGHIIGVKDENERKHISVLDDERRLRYRLEQAQNELVNSKKEIERFTEIRERNRIAHEIHDNIGHSIAGVIFQLEAAIRIFHKDYEKTEDILKLCSQKLAEALELTRNTVYNIRVDKKIGLASIEKVINDYKFCQITFEHSGDFSQVSASNLEILKANIMESLTNASKYSKATSIQIKIDIGRKNIRLYYRDNGIGCRNISENIGISGMRDRVKNAGGTISIDGNSGFLIVCNLPISKEEIKEVEML